MEIESAKELMHAGDEPAKRLFCRKVPKPMLLHLERAYSLVALEKNVSHYIQGADQYVDVPSNSDTQWIIVCEKPFTVPYGFCGLGQYIIPKHRDQRHSFGLSGSMQLRFLYSTGFWSLIALAGDAEMLTADDVLKLVRDVLFNSLRRMLHESLAEEPWEYRDLFETRKHLPEYLYPCFDEAFAQYGICVIRGSLRITGCALKGNNLAEEEEEIA